MQKSIVLMLVISLSTVLAVKTDSNPIQAVLTGLSVIEKIEQLYQGKDKDKNDKSGRSSKKSGKEPDK